MASTELEIKLYKIIDDIFYIMMKSNFKKRIRQQLTIDIFKKIILDEGLEIVNIATPELMQKCQHELEANNKVKEESNEKLVFFFLDPLEAQVFQLKYYEKKSIFYIAKVIHKNILASKQIYKEAKKKYFIYSKVVIPLIKIHYYLYDKKYNTNSLQMCELILEKNYTPVQIAEICYISERKAYYFQQEVFEYLLKIMPQAQTIKAKIHDILTK